LSPTTASAFLCRLKTGAGSFPDQVGTTSSSDGQYFPAGGHAEAIGDLNARYGPNPGAKFYRFTSDQSAHSTSSP